MVFSIVNNSFHPVLPFCSQSSPDSPVQCHHKGKAEVVGVGSGVDCMCLSPAGGQLPPPMPPVDEAPVAPVDQPQVPPVDGAPVAPVPQREEGRGRWGQQWS